MDCTTKHEWFSDDHIGRDKYDAWCSILNERFGQWSPTNLSDKSFYAKTISRQIDNTQFVDCICDPCSAERGNKFIRSTNIKTLTFQLVLSGQENFSVGDERYQLSCGDILIWNDLMPMRFDVLNRLHKISITIPLSRFRSWLPHQWHSIPHYHPQGSTTATLLTSLILSSTPHAFQDHLRNGDAIADALLGILVGVLGESNTHKTSGFRQSHLLNAQQYILKHLDDPNLSPEQVAHACHISIRYLHNLFKDTGSSVQQYILTKRLEKIHHDLTNPSMQTRTITDIAFTWGFQSSAHFSRRFKEEFHYTPREFRRLMLKADT